MEALKELKEVIGEKTKVSRRSFLKGLGALSATAAIYGCGGGGASQSSYVTDASAPPATNLALNSSWTTVMASHPYNCGGRCGFKIWINNGVMQAVTSGFADVPRTGTTCAQPADESVSLPQFRPCLKGYTMAKRVYQPDRLQVPLMQTIERGNLNGFTQISWTQAFETIAQNYQNTIARKSALGYIPGNNGVFSYFGVGVSFSGSPSTDNMAEGVYGTIGKGATSNGLPDMLNSQFVLCVGGNTSATFTHQFPSNWFFTKAKEAGIPIVVVDSIFNDHAATLGTGYSKYNLPSFIAVRPGTDAALFAAMACVIYANNLHNTAYLSKYCFGFNPGDTCVSTSAQKNPVTGVAYKGQTFTVPTGMSFVEYLNGLMTNNGGLQGVLNWASQITGAPAATIQNLALAYAQTTPSFIYGIYGGAARSVSGYYLPMMAVAVAAMTGQSNRVGGGPGITSCADPTPVTLGSVPLTTATTSGTISMSAFATSKVLLTGTDNRDYNQLRADVLALNSIDLGAYTAAPNNAGGHDGRVRIEMIGISNSNQFNQRSGPMSRLMYALQNPSAGTSNVKFIYGADHFMTPTMAMCDIVLPETTHLEWNSYQSKPLIYYFSNQAIQPMYSCQSSGYITSNILNLLGVPYGLYGPAASDGTDLNYLSKQWTGATIASGLLAITPTATLPSFTTYTQQGIFQLPEPPANAPLGTAGTTAAGNFVTETGKLQFFSPFLFSRDQSLGAAYQHPDGGYYRSTFPPKAMYGVPIEGFNATTGAFLGSQKGAKIMKGTGQNAVYTLQHSHAKHRRRAHSVYDNVAMLKQNFPGVAHMNIADAAARGISEGDNVYIYNDWGCCKVVVTLTNRILQGVVHIGEGEWYRASATETYQAWFDATGSGVAQMHVVPVDVGGATNNLIPDRDTGPRDPAVGTYDNSFHGNFVEVSLTHPDA